MSLRHSRGLSALALVGAVGAIVVATEPPAAVAQTQAPGAAQSTPAPAVAQPSAGIVPPVRRVAPKTPPLPLAVGKGTSNKVLKAPAKNGKSAAKTANGKAGGAKPARRCVSGKIYDAVQKKCFAATSAAALQKKAAPGKSP